VTIEISRLTLRPPPSGLRFAYESLCWGTHVSFWEQSWTIVQRIDRDNFGLCLDTFNIAGRVYADPARPSGRTPDADAAMAASIARLVAQVDVRKVFYVEVVDAERLQHHLTPAHPFYDAAQPARMSWSRNCRLFYGEADRGAYLPVRAISAALLQRPGSGGLGFEGWVSFELFNRSLVDPAEDTPRLHAARGAESWRALQRDVEFEVRVAETQRMPVVKRISLGFDEKTCWPIKGAS